MYIYLVPYVRKKTRGLSGIVVVFSGAEIRFWIEWTEGWIGGWWIAV